MSAEKLEEVYTPQRQISEKAFRIAERIMCGIGLKYDPAVHIPLMLDTVGKAEGYHAFCAEAEISSNTFFRWLKKEPQFAKAYEVAQELGRRIWDKKGIEGAEDPAFNIKQWQVIAKNLHGYAEQRALNIPKLRNAKSSMQKMTVITNEIADGKLTGHEAKQLAEIVVATVKVEEATDREKRLGLLEEVFLDKLNSVRR
jgi:Asp-tRNA(Asn)/Glu-tRNA(Gln) amidotransferase B subunit